MGNTFTLKLRKFVATLSLTTLLASMLVVPQASGASLDDAPSWARNAVEELADLSQSSLRLNDATDKCEFSKMLTVAFGLEEETLDPFTFTDVPEWAKGYVGAMVNNEIAKGDSATKFGCGAPMSRAVQVKMIVNALGLEEGTLDSKYDSEFAGVEWAKGAFAAALTEGIVKGDDSTGALRPAANANRAESFVLAYRAMGGDESEGEEVEIPGDLKVTVASTTPAAKSVPKNGFEVPYTTFKFSAEGSDADVEIKQIVVTRAGLGSSSNFTAVKLYSNGKQLGSEKTVSSSTNTATFNFSTPVVVPKGGFMEVEVRGDMAGGTIDGAQNQFGIAAATDVTTNGDAVGGTFPAYGNVMTLANVSVGSLEFDQEDVTGDLEVGDTDEVLGRVELEAGSAEDLRVTQLRYRQAGSVDGEKYLANLKLYNGGTLVGQAPKWDGDYAVFDFSPVLEIDKGDDVNLELRGDVTGGIDSTVSFEVRDEKDVVAYGEVLGFRANVSQATGDTDPTDRDIVGGDLNFALAAKNPPSQQVAIGVKDHEFMRFNVTTAGDAITVEDFALILNPTTGKASEITDIKISRVNSDGSFTNVAGPVDGTTTTDSNDETLTFTEDWDIEAQKTTEFVVTGDVATTVSANDTFVFSIDVSAIGAVYDSGSRDDVEAADITPSSDVTGSTFTVSAPTLTVGLASTPASKTVVKNSKDIQVSAFNLVANTVSDIKVTSVTLTQYDGDGDATKDDLTNVRLYTRGDSGALTPLSTSGKNLNDDEEVTFSGVSILVPKGKTVTLVVVADVPSSATAGRDFGIGIAASDITAQDGESRTSTVTVSGLPKNNGETVKLTVAASGTLSAGTDGETPSAYVLTTNSDMNLVHVVKYTANVEAFKINSFTVQGTDAAADELESYTVKYKDAAGTERTVTQSVDSAADSLFDLADGQELFVPAGSDAKLYIYANTNSEADGADSGQTLAVTVADDTDFEAFATGSNSRVTDAGEDITGNTHTVYASKVLVAKASDTPTSSSVTAGSGQEVFKFNLTAKGESTPTLVALAATVSGTATLATTANGSATLVDNTGETEATEAFVDAPTDDGGSTDVTFGAADGQFDGIPRGANVLIYDHSETTYYPRVVTALATGLLTFTPAIDSFTDAASDALYYMPLQPGSGKLYFGAATTLGANLVDNTTTSVTVTSTDGFAIGDSFVARGARSTGVVIECTGTISAIPDATTITLGAATQCTGDATLDYDYDSLATAVAYVGGANDYIDEEITGTEKFTVKGDLTGVTPSSGTRTVQVRINAGSDVDFHDDFADLGDDLDDAFENTLFLINNNNLNLNETGFEQFPINGSSLSFSN
jgi:hypothetical protein